MREDLVIIGGGLAGSEAAWQAANQGARVTLYEMRPKEPTPAHKTGFLAELVCSNSLGSDDSLSAPGILKAFLEAILRVSVSWRSRQLSDGKSRVQTACKPDAVSTSRMLGRAGRPEAV